MVERRDAGRSHAQQDFSVRDRWFWKIDELQSFITTEFFRPHCTHIRSPIHCLRECLVQILHYASVSDPHVERVGRPYHRAGDSTFLLNHLAEKAVPASSIRLAVRRWC